MAAPQIRPRPPARPLRGAAWLGARATLAGRRTRRFARWWLSLGGAATIVALMIPVATGDPDATTNALLTRHAADTLRAASQLRRAIAGASSADSAQEALAKLAPAEIAAPPPRPALDPRLISIDAALAMARAARTSASFLSLAADPAIAYGPRVRAIADTLERAALAMEESPLTGASDRSSQLATVRRLGFTIISIAQNRRDELAGSGETLEPVRSNASGESPTAAAIEVASRTAAAWKDSVSRAQAAYAAALEAASLDVASPIGPRPGQRAPSPGLVTIVVLIAGLSLRFALALSHEARAPRLANSAEAESAIGAPVLAVVRDALPDGPMRFRPSGVDPFRVLYLGLTSTGTRARTLIVTGTDPVVTGAVGARLAIAAAADHRTTLVLDVDPEQIALARVFRAPPEPGFTDALAGAFRWRDVARPVGSSDGLAITMLSAGTTRDEPPEGDALNAARAEFTRFREGFEFTIIIASLRDLPRALATVPVSPVVLCGSVGRTGVEEFMQHGAELALTGLRAHGIVLWDAPRPELPSRAELAAHLSKQKGRTPGGSFEAVKRATGTSGKDINKPV